MSKSTRLTVAKAGPAGAGEIRQSSTRPSLWEKVAVQLVACVAIGLPAVAQCPPEWLPGGGFDVLDRQLVPGWPNSARISSLEVLANGNLVAAGSFTAAGGAAVQNVALWDGSTWSSLGIGANGVQNGSPIVVRELANGDLVTGGLALQANNQSSAMVRWNGSTWQPFGNLGGVSQFYVTAMATTASGGLFVGGKFDTANGVPASCIARWDGSVWSPLGVGIGGVDPVVKALVVMPNGDLVVGGSFSTAGGAPASCIARWDGSNWSQVGPGTGGVFPDVEALAVLPNGDLIAAGAFTMAGGVTAHRVARWDGLAWSPLGLGLDGSVTSLAVLPGGDLIVGGYFGSAGGVAAANLARWDGSTWTPLDQRFGNAPAALDVLADGTLIVGGDFTSYLSHARTIARWGCPTGLAEVRSFGYGCGDQVASYFEYFDAPPASFDLSGSTIRMTPSGSGYAVDHLVGSPVFATPSSPDLGLGDDDLTQPIALPFQIPYPGGTTNQIQVGSNGYVFLQTDWRTAPLYGNWPQLTTGAPRFAPLWGDLDPATGTGSGTIHVDIDTTNQVVYATWGNVQEWNVPQAVSTFQVALFANGIVEYRYLTCGHAVAPVLAGWSPGNGVPLPASRDISAAPHFQTSALPHTLPLTQRGSRPGLGTTVTLTTSEVPATSPLGATVIGWAHYIPGIDLASLGMPGCYQFVGADVSTFQVPSNGQFAHTFSIPNDAVFVGAHLHSQALALVPGVNPFGALTSNGVDLGLGRM